MVSGLVEDAQSMQTLKSAGRRPQNPQELKTKNGVYSMKFEEILSPDLSFRDFQADGVTLRFLGKKLLIKNQKGMIVMEVKDGTVELSKKGYRQRFTYEELKDKNVEYFVELDPSLFKKQKVDPLVDAIMGRDFDEEYEKRQKMFWGKVP